MKNLGKFSNVHMDNGSSLLDDAPVGYRSNLQISFEKLVELFGEDYSTNGGHKVDAEWCIVADSERMVIATIYNWKDGFAYSKEAGKSLSEIRDWHIGGNSMEAVELVNMLIDGNIKLV